MSTATTTSGGASAPALVSPLPGVDRQDNFGAPRPNGRTHEGIDIFADKGTPIHAISGGTVVNGFSNPLGGTVVWVQGDDGRTYYYAHLDSLAPDLELGDRVDTGEVIGTVGNTGNAATTPSHLHLQVKDHGTWINPYDFLADVPDTVPGESLDQGQPPEPHDDVAAYDPDPGPPPQAADGDGDGLTDEFEALLNTDPADPDSDDDGLTDLHETTVTHTNPLSADTDSDAIVDAVEIAGGTDAGTAPIPEAAVHAHFGGLETWDSDSDGLSDAYEIDAGTSPASADSDSDSLPDALEIALGSSPVSNDSDADGITDNAEYELGTLQPMASLGEDQEDGSPFQPDGGQLVHDHHGPHEHADPSGDPAGAAAGAGWPP